MDVVLSINKGGHFANKCPKISSHKFKKFLEIDEFIDDWWPLMKNIFQKLNQTKKKWLNIVKKCLELMA
jgi:hypothetical protein